MLSELLEIEEQNLALEQQNFELRAENFRLRKQIAAYASAVDRMRLNLSEQAKEEECRTNSGLALPPTQ